MDLPSPSEYISREVASYQVTRSRFDLAFADAPPFRSSFFHCWPEMRLPGPNSHGVRISFTALPELLAHYVGNLSWGFVPLQRIRGGESTLPVSRDLPAGPTQPTTVPLAGFATSQRLFSSPRRPAIFQTGNARGVLPFRGLLLPRSLETSSVPMCSLDVSPNGLA